MGDAGVLCWQRESYTTVLTATPSSPGAVTRSPWALLRHGVVCGDSWWHRRDGWWHRRDLLLQREGRPGLLLPNALYPRVSGGVKD